MTSNARPNPLLSKLYISNSKGIFLLNIDDILRAEANSNYCMIYCKDGKKYTISKTLKHLESKLPDFKFIRVHKSHIVRIEEITFIDNHEIHLGTHAVIPISRTYKNQLNDLISLIK